MIEKNKCGGISCKYGVGGIEKEKRKSWKKNWKKSKEKEKEKRSYKEHWKYWKKKKSKVWELEATEIKSEVKGQNWWNLP